jgi:hypothetical protein
MSFMRSIQSPKDLRARIRWLFVIGSMFSLLLLINDLLFVSEAAVVQRAIAAALLVVYGVETVRCYLNGRWPRYIPLVELVTLVVAAVTIGTSTRCLGCFTSRCISASCTAALLSW